MDVLNNVSTGGGNCQAVRSLQLRPYALDKEQVMETVRGINIPAQ